MDNAVITVQNPLESLPITLEFITTFGSMVGFYINKDKTKILTQNLNNQIKERLEIDLGNKVDKKVKYLGVLITSKKLNLSQDNYNRV